MGAKSVTSYTLSPTITQASVGVLCCATSSYASTGASEAAAAMAPAGSP